MNQDVLAQSHSALGEERVVSSHEDFRHRGSFGPIESVRNACQMVCGNGDEFALSATADDAEDAIASLPFAHFIAHLCDFAGEFDSGNVLRITGRRRIAAKPLQDVRAIQSRCPHAHPNAI